MSFLDYTGEYTARGDKFIFKMKGGKRKTSKFFTIISDPTYDNAFKTMLCFQKSILKSLLNSVLFPESKLIEKLEYSKTYFPGKLEINSRYGAGSKSIDVGCKCFLKKDNNLKEVQVLNKDGNAVITMKFNSIKYSDKFDKDNFNLDSLISTNECKGDENCNTESTKDEPKKDENDKTNENSTNDASPKEPSSNENTNTEQSSEKTTSILDNIVYPLYLPKDTHLSTKDTVDTDNGDRVIMTYAGAKPFMIIEEAASVSKEMEVTSVSGDPLLLSMAVGALSSNSLEWQSNNVEYYITSSYLSSEELMTIAESLNTASVVEITNK